jgi:rod shape-determining protein MreC
MRDLFNFLFAFRDIVLFVGLMTLSFILLINNNTYHGAWYFTTSNEISGDILTFRSDLADYVDLKRENEKLRTENANARTRHRSSYSPVANQFVRIQDSIFRQEYRYLDARVVNSTFSKQQNFLTLAGGSKAGIAPDMGVIGHDGVIGVVQQVSENYALVMSVLNTKLEISVEVERNGYFGILVWDSNDPTTASVRDIAKHADVRVGDRFITRGSGGIFPRGQTVGEVVEATSEPGANYLDIKIRLAQDLTRSSHAYIVTDLYKQEKDSLENTVQP